MKTVFEYLIETESADRDFHFDRDSNNGLIISYVGYKHMNFYSIIETLRKTYKLKFNFDKGIEEFDQHCGRTYCFFKNVYTNN
jgi:hypothetical protein